MVLPGFFKKILVVDWKEESDPLFEDFAVVPLLALFFPTVRFFLDRFVFEKLAKRCILGRGHYKLDVDIEERRKVKKFKESAWKLVYFLSAEILALSVTYDEPWLRNTKCFWVGPGEQVWPDQKTKLKLKGLYMYGAGFYTYSIFALIFWETRRSDFAVSMGHHVASVILIVLSYIFRFTRVGSIVLALHDASDVFIETGKMSKYSGYECYEVLLDLDKEKHKVDGPIYYYLFNTLLFCLLVIHIYWWVLMCRMLANQIKARGRLGDDVRSDSESEDEHAD
ncbi:hypothetical protein AAC387_Pa07g1844 [Persea americana]